MKEETFIVINVGHATLQHTIALQSDLRPDSCPTVWLLEPLGDIQCLPEGASELYFIDKGIHICLPKTEKWYQMKRSSTCAEFFPKELYAHKALQPKMVKVSPQFLYGLGTVTGRADKNVSTPRATLRFFLQNS